ncbi:hypothetical protein F4823DRAFT_585698 [Ustulina deusta]|nr:hypothetical protein F4823DRAFT_585698 [Ustulina deusta]
METIDQLKSENPNVDTEALTPLAIDVTGDASITAAKKKKLPWRTNSATSTS